MKLLHLSFWFGVYGEPVEWAWFPEDDLSWITERVSDGRFDTIYTDEAMVMAIL